jgi:hypothetical protein
MKVIRYRDAARFLKQATPFLSAAEVENQMLLGMQVQRLTPHDATGSDGLTA